MKDIAKQLITIGFDINKCFKDRKTVLMHACVKGMKDVVELIFLQNVDINARDVNGKTALMYVSNGHKEYRYTIDIVNKLLSVDADVNIIDTLNKTALIYACDMESDIVAKILLDAKADYNVLFICKFNYNIFDMNIFNMNIFDMKQKFKKI